MKTLRGLKILDFSIQAVLIGGMLSVAFVSTIFNASEFIQYLWIPYFVLGGWQLVVALVLRYQFHFYGINSYLKLVGIFALFAASFLGIGYVGGSIYRAFFGFIWIFLLWISLVPPVLAIGRFAGAFYALENKTEHYEQVLVS